MANYCNYEVRVIGSKKAGLMVYESMPCMDFKDYDSEEMVGDSCLICFSGNCKWSVNFGVNDHMPKVNLESMSELDIEEKGVDYWEYSLRAKSEAFQCEIMVHYWSDESGFDQFDHYKNGEIVKQRKIAYNYEEANVFDWDKTEFFGYEGEYDESVDGEEQNEKFMATLMMALGGGAPPSEPDMNDEDQEILADLTEKIADLNRKIAELAAEEGVDIDAAPIGDTGFDMFKWSFTEGKTARGRGWTIAIPDGFVRINSNDVALTTGQKRIFELVPATHKDEKDLNEIPVRILPGAEQDGTGLGDHWMVHPNARAGIASILGMTTAQFMSKMMGTSSGILSVGWSDVAAHILVQDTTGGSYSYQCSVLTGKKHQMLRVQTQYMTENQKHYLDLSVQEWLKTMWFDEPNKACPTKTKFEDPSCFNELLKGRTEKFEEAVDQAKTEYMTAINGKIKCLEYAAEEGLLDEYTGETIKGILEDGMAVKLFFLQKADRLIDKLKEKSVAASVLKDVMQKLYGLDEDFTEINYDDEVIEIAVPEAVQNLRDKWKQIASEASKVAREEEMRKAEEERLRKEREETERKRKAEEERLRKEKEEEERKARIATAKESYAQACNQMEAELRDSYNANVSQAEREYFEAKQIVQEETKQLENEKAQLNEHLLTLGIFKLSEKKQIRARMSEIDAKLEEMNEKKTGVQSRFDKKKRALKKEFEKAFEKRKQELEREILLPNGLCSEGAGARETVTKSVGKKPKTNEEKVFAIMKKDTWYLTSELMEKAGLTNMSYTSFYYVVKRLLEAGKIERRETSTRTYFRKI